MQIVDTNDFVMPTDAASQDKIRKAIQEVANSLARMDAEREFIKEALDPIQEEFGIKPKHLRKIARVYHKGNFGDEEQDFNAFETGYRTLFNDT